MYNYRLKSYGNGTAQLSYYHHPIMSKEDYEDFAWPTNFDSVKYRINSKKEDEQNISYDFQEVTEWLKTPFDELSTEELRERSIQSSLNRTKKMIYDYGRSNTWDWFFTLTFKPVEEFNKENFEECKKKVMEWFKNVRKRYCENIKYIVVPEMHVSRCWHFHCLVSNCDKLTFEVAKNQRRYLKNKDGSYQLNEYGAKVLNNYFGEDLRTHYPDGQLIYNIKQFKNGWTTATRIQDTRKAVSYVLKYITVDLCDIAFGKQRYMPSKNLDLPVITTMLDGFNDVNKLVSGIEYSTGLKLSIECIKSYSVDIGSYINKITVFEFDTPEVPGDDFQGRELRLNEIMEDIYG